MRAPRSRLPAPSIPRGRARLLPAFALVAVSSAALGVTGRDLLDRDHADGRASTVAGHPAAAAESPGGEGFSPAAAGPWGIVERNTFYLRPPANAFETMHPGAVRWHFSESRPDHLDALFEQAGLDPAHRTSLLANTDCAGGSCYVPVSTEIVRGISPAARAVIYPVLAKSSGNFHAMPFRWHTDDDAELRRALPGLSDAAFAELRAMTWRDGDNTAFADAETLSSLVPEDERVSVARALNTSPAVRLRLRVGPNDDVAAMASYWSPARDVQPLLESIARSPGGHGGAVGVLYLLPSFARARAYTFPEGGDGSDGRARQNCFWTAMNFARATPDDTFSEEPRTREELKSAWVEVGRPELRLGDVMVVERLDGVLVHAAVHVAANVWFTRNGYVRSRPFVLMDYSDIITRYPEGLVRFYRRRA